MSMQASDQTLAMRPLDQQLTLELDQIRTIQTLNQLLVLELGRMSGVLVSGQTLAESAFELGSMRTEQVEETGHLKSCQIDCL